MKWISFLIFAASVSCGTLPKPEVSTPDRQPDSLQEVLIYDGPGACTGCPQEIRALVERAGYSARLVKPNEINARRLAAAALYIQPGGDNTMQVRRAVGPQGLAAIKNYVHDGGKFLGICLGGALGSTGPDDDGSRMLGLLPVEAFESGNMTARLVPVEIPPFGRRTSFVQDPPSFRLLNPADKSVSVIARYSDQRIAGVSGNFGKGKAVLLGPHFEAGTDWARHFGLNDPDGNEHDVFNHILKNLLPPTGCPACSPPKDPEAAR